MNIHVETTIACPGDAIGLGEAAVAGTWVNEAHAVLNDDEKLESSERRAARAILCYFPDYDDCDAQTGMADLLTDLRHLCDLMGWSFSEIDEKAIRQHRAEVADCGYASDEKLSKAITRDLM